MRGTPCTIHPKHVLGKKSSVCGRTDKAVEVEDHGNGYMFLGTSDLSQACRILSEYVDNIEDYRFAARLYYSGVCAVWLSDEPLALWDGAEGRNGYERPAGYAGGPGRTGERAPTRRQRKLGLLDV